MALQMPKKKPAKFILLKIRVRKSSLIWNLKAFRMNMLMRPQQRWRLLSRISILQYLFQNHQLQKLLFKKKRKSSASQGILVAPMEPTQSQRCLHRMKRSQNKVIASLALQKSCFHKVLWKSHKQQKIQILKMSKRYSGHGLTSSLMWLNSKPS